MKLKNMASAIPYGTCPVCRSKQFVVSCTQQDLYLTNGDGEIIDGKELMSYAYGKCVKCGTETEMFSTKDGFIPLTPIRKIIYGYSKPEEDMKNHMNLPITENPMEAKK